MISKDLYEFLKSWRDWVRAGAPNGKPYYRLGGLCDNAYHAPHGTAPFVRPALGFELGEAAYPFGYENYWSRHWDQTQHEDPARLAWVDSKIAEYEAQQ